MVISANREVLLLRVGLTVVTITSCVLVETWKELNARLVNTQLMVPLAVIAQLVSSVPQVFLLLIVLLVTNQLAAYQLAI